MLSDRVRTDPDPHSIAVASLGLLAEHLGSTALMSRRSGSAATVRRSGRSIDAVTSTRSRAPSPCRTFRRHSRVEATTLVIADTDADWKLAQQQVPQLQEEVARARLRESEERFRLLVESVRNYAIFTVDCAGVITSWPAGAAAVFGWSEAEILGRSVDLIFVPEDLAGGEVLREGAPAGSARRRRAQRPRAPSQGRLADLHRRLHPASRRRKRQDPGVHQDRAGRHRGPPRAKGSRGEGATRGEARGHGREDGMVARQANPRLGSAPSPREPQARCS